MKNLFFTTVIALTLFGCSKDDDNATGNPNNYSYLGERTDIDTAEYLDVDGDTYLYLSSEDNFSNYVVIMFDNRSFADLTSVTYTLNQDGANILLDTSFDLAYLTTEDNPLGDQASQGEVTIVRNNDDTLKISFELTTDNGVAEGQYEGVFVAR